MAETVSEILTAWLTRQLTPPQIEWLDGQRAKLAADPSLRNIQIGFGMVPRRLGKDDLALLPADFDAAAAVRADWDPTDWSIDNAARVLLLIEAGGKTNNFAAIFTTMCQHADVAEAVALYRGLPLYPDPADLEPQAGEGLRTNMRSIFEAIAHNNPYPREQFDENRWNHMVLKALFVESRLDPIQGLDARANPELARILRDYAHERWAASRAVTPELWRCVGPYAEGAALADLGRLIDDGDANERRAAALALTASASPQAPVLLEKLPEQRAEIDAGTLTWHTLAANL